MEETIMLQMFVGICNPDALNIRICNPKIALKCLYSMQVDCKST